MAKIVALEPLFERIPAPDRKFKEVAVFVHHYGGHRYSFKRHIEWLSEIGFDCVTFNLPFHNMSQIHKRLPLNKEWNLGLRHVWADKIEQVLGSIVEDKFLFSFSSPSAAALTALERRHAIDVKAWICDGGPFADLSLSIENLIHAQGLFKISSRLLQIPILSRSLANLCAVALGFYNYKRDSQKSLQALPKGFPIISIRGGNDHLVSGDMIDTIFLSAFNHVDLQRVILHTAGHLTGLKDEPDNYKYAVGNFLKSRGTPFV